MKIRSLIGYGDVGRKDRLVILTKTFVRKDEWI